MTIRRTTIISTIVASALVTTACAASSHTSTKVVRSAKPAVLAAAGTAPSPPGGSPPGGGGPTATYTDTGAYKMTTGSASFSHRSFTASGSDESGVLVSGGQLTLTDPTITTSGNSQSSDESSFFGLNAGVLAESSGQIAITGGSVRTSGTGANGIFAFGSGAKVTISGTTVKATAGGAHGIMASGGGTLKATDVSISTAGQSAAAVATDRGGGTIDVTGGVMKTSGFKSPGIYSTGKIAVRDAKMTATGAEAAVVEGANSITAIDTTLHAAVGHGVMLYNSMSGDAQAGTGYYTMQGGTLTAAAGPAFYVTNTHGVISIANGAVVTAKSGVLVRSDNAGTGSGNTGAGVTSLTIAADKLSGNLDTGGTGTISVKLQDHAQLTGTIDAAGLTLDAGSRWVVSGNSVITTLADAAKISGMKITNIIGDGHTVTYDSALNSWLHGKTYSLADGGHLRPA